MHTVVLHAHFTWCFVRYSIVLNLLEWNFLSGALCENCDTSISNFEEEILAIWVWPKFPKNKRKKKKLLTSLWGVRWPLLWGMPNSLAVNLSCQAVEKFQVCLEGTWFPSISLLKNKQEGYYLYSLANLVLQYIFTPWEGEDDIILPSPSYN